MAPPVTCRRCGSIVDHPYEMGNIQFQYRASEHLLSLLEVDSLPHLIAARFLRHLFDSGRSSYIYGMYPGVTMRKGGREFEADVLILLADGRLVPGECKRTASGLKQRDLDNLDELCGLLESPWSFVATLDLAESCGPLWRTAERVTDDRRYVFTAEHLLSMFPSWALNGNPLRFGGDDTLRLGPSLANLLVDSGHRLTDTRPQFTINDER
jgi:hypothetical protein